jgi:hypothetical protein
MKIILKDLPKVSLNVWYSSKHWSFRKKLKDNYTLLVKSQFKDVLPASGSYNTEYHFTFKSRPLDASNCVAMVKMIEDIIFENDGYKIIKSILITSGKGAEDMVEIKINKNK